jgi:SAM-dependent methyltransferase
VEQPVTFTCNICGSPNRVADFATEPATCACGSNVRVRALVHLLAMELFGRSLTLTDFPKLKSIHGLGMTDKPGYAAILADKFDYTNTYYDRPPRFDFSQPHPDLYSTCDFILSADVLEHVAPPVERTLEEICRLLKPRGFLAATVPCTRDGATREHFPDLHEYRVVRLGNSQVLVNRRRDGGLEVRGDLVFHEGPGAVLEMRQFGVTELRAQLLAAGFREVHFLTDAQPEAGILFDDDVSQPLVARKERFALDGAAVSQLMENWAAATRQLREAKETAATLAERIRLASESRWVRLGRKFGLGPKFSG